VDNLHHNQNNHHGPNDNNRVNAMDTRQIQPTLTPASTGIKGKLSMEQARLFAQFVLDVAYGKKKNGKKYALSKRNRNHLKERSQNSTESEMSEDESSSSDDGASTASTEEPEDDDYRRREDSFDSRSDEEESDNSEQDRYRSVSRSRSRSKHKPNHSNNRKLKKDNRTKKYRRKVIYSNKHSKDNKDKDRDTHERRIMNKEEKNKKKATI